MASLSKGALHLSAACFAKAKPLQRLGGAGGWPGCPCSTMVAAAPKPATWDGALLPPNSLPLHLVGASGTSGTRHPWLAVPHAQRSSARASAELPTPCQLVKGCPHQTHPSAASAGSGSQADLMHKDECITVDAADAVTGSASKFDSHRFTPEQPRGRLHRAFSVFLFDGDSRLLLQQRARAKVTFPGVWTNTCCSHPLHGRAPSEVDGPEDVAAGTVMGAKRAAVRKLQHELGIPPQQLPLSGFRFLTRLHYCAPDTGTYGPDAEWGEHEVDYILFTKAAVSLAENRDEVEASRYVDMAELREMMRPESGLHWSPWFRIIADNFLERWWADLDGVLSGQAHQDFSTIHRIL